jgi:hypothetical protein
LDHVHTASSHNAAAAGPASKVVSTTATPSGSSKFGMATVNVPSVPWRPGLTWSRNRDLATRRFHHREAIVPGPAPAPEANRRRRNLVPGVRQLPAAGRPAAAPSWPLRATPSDEEVGLWDELWASPQAVAWADMGAGVARVVARYVRWTVAAEVGIPADVATSALAELRQLEDRLGLTPMALARLHWTIDQPPAADPSDQGGKPAMPQAPAPDLPMRPAQRRRVRAQDTG